MSLDNRIEAKNFSIKCDGADDYYALYQNGFYVNINRRNGKFYWDHDPDRHILYLNDDVKKKALRILRTEILDEFSFRFNSHSSMVLDHLQDKKIKPRSWLNRHVRLVYEAMLSSGYTFTMEAYSGELLVGGMFGIALGELVTFDTMYGLREPNFRSASKALMMAAIPELISAGIRVLDGEVEHSTNHPATRLGEQKIAFEDFRDLLEKFGRTGPNRLFSHFNSCWPAGIEKAKGDER